MRKSDGTVLLLYYDQVGSLRVVADAGGNVIKEILYDPFGGIIEDYRPELRIPLGFADGDPDWYGYCLDDPVNAVDPLGLFVFLPFLAGMLGATGLAGARAIGRLLRAQLGVEEVTGKRSSSWCGF